MGMVRGTTAPMASRWWGRSRVGEGKHVGAAAAQEAVDVEEEQQGARMRGSRAEEPGHGRLGRSEEHTSELQSHYSSS